MRPSELDDSVLNEMLVGVATSVEEETDDGNIGTDVNGWSGDGGGAEVRGDRDPGIVLIRSTDDADPLGRKKDFSNDTSTSCSAIDIGWKVKVGELKSRMRNSTQMPMVGDHEVGQTTKFA